MSIPPLTSLTSRFVHEPSGEVRNTYAVATLMGMLVRGSGAMPTSKPSHFAGFLFRGRLEGCPDDAGCLMSTLGITPRYWSATLTTAFTLMPLAAGC